MRSFLEDFFHPDSEILSLELFEESPATFDNYGLCLYFIGKVGKEKLATNFNLVNDLKIVHATSIQFIQSFILN